MGAAGGDLRRMGTVAFLVSPSLYWRDVCFGWSHGGRVCAHFVRTWFSEYVALGVREVWLSYLHDSMSCFAEVCFRWVIFSF